MEFEDPEDGVYDVVHVPADKVHVSELNEPPALPSLHDTIPSGVVDEVDVSVTVEVNIIAVPDVKETEFGLMITDVECIVTTARDSIEELVTWVISPP